MPSAYFVHLAVLLFSLLLILDEVTSQPATATECPPKFKNGDNEVKCVIFTANIDCKRSPQKVQIILTENGVNSVDKDQDYPPSSCTSAPNSGEVGCISETNTTYTYLYKFVASNETKEGNTLQCQFPCFGGNAVFGEACRITFKEPDEGSSLSPGAIAGIAIASVAVVAVIILVAVKLVQGKKGHGYAATST